VWSLLLHFFTPEMSLRTLITDLLHLQVLGVHWAGRRVEWPQEFPTTGWAVCWNWLWCDQGGFPWLPCTWQAAANARYSYCTTHGVKTFCKNLHLFYSFLCYECQINKMGYQHSQHHVHYDRNINRDLNHLTITWHTSKLQKGDQIHLDQSFSCMLKPDNVL